MKILLTGAAGQLGTELLPLLSARGQVTATDRNIPGNAEGTWLELDICDGGKLERLLDDVTPDLIVNAAAYTAVDQAETEVETASDVNARFPGRLAHWARHNDARLLHYSTDYVFDGTASRPYLETDKADPQSVYGQTKLEGEQVIAASGCIHATIRTSWVYSSHGNNFVLSMLDLARRGISLKVVDDQQGCPTWARNLAMASDKILEQWRAAGTDRRSGLFHYSDDRTLSWYGFAQAVFECAMRAGLLNDTPDLAPVPSSGYPQPASRPKWSVLDTNKIKSTFDIHPAPFNRSLEAVMDEVAKRASL